MSQEDEQVIDEQVTDSESQVSVTLAMATGSVTVAEIAGSVPIVAAAGSITDPEAVGSVPTAAAVPMLSIGTSRDPEELERSCLLDAAFEALLPDRCPRVCPWIGVLPRVCPWLPRVCSWLGCSISMILLFVPFLDDIFSNVVMSL